MLSSNRNFFNLIWQRIKSTFEGRRTTIYDISHNTDCIKLSWLTLENECGERIIEWSNVVSIHVYKRDLYTVDLICLCLNLRDETTIEIHEEMNGWTGLIEKLPEYLQGCQKFEEWFVSVAFPAFQENLMKIYQRGSQ